MEKKNYVLVFLGNYVFIGKVESFVEKEGSVSMVVEKPMVVQILLEAVKNEKMRMHVVAVPFITDKLIFINPNAYTFLNEDNNLVKEYILQTTGLEVPKIKIEEK